MSANVKQWLGVVLLFGAGTAHILLHGAGEIATLVLAVIGGLLVDPDVITAAIKARFSRHDEP